MQERKNGLLIAFDVYERLRRAVQIYGSEDRLEVSTRQARVSLEIGKRENFGRIRVWYVDANNIRSFVVLSKEGPNFYEEDRLQELGSFFDNVVLRMKGGRPLDLLSAERANELARQLFSKIEPVFANADTPITL